MTKWCNNCEEYTEKDYIGYLQNSRDFLEWCKFNNNRCENCYKWSLVEDKDKNLYDWWLSRDISTEQKNVIKKFGVDASSSSKKKYNKLDLVKLWYWDDILKKNYVGTPGRIQQMNFFSAWWNNNLILVINGEGDYGIHLLVYEMPMKIGNPSSGPLERFYIGNFSLCLSDVKNLVKATESNLRGEKNPILSVSSFLHIGSTSRDPYSNNTNIVTVNYETDYNSNSYPMTFENGIVKRSELPLNDAISNPDNYIKPLDIVLACEKNPKRNMVHSCVYLGYKDVCHVLGEQNENNKSGRVKIESWSKFLNIIYVDKLLRYHPVIPFKKHDEIIRHIAKAVEGANNYFSPGTKTNEGSFSICKDSGGSSNNCENFTNVCVFGINFSELSARRVGIRNAKFDIKSCIKETSEKMDKLTSDWYASGTIREIERYKYWGNSERIASEIDREGIEMQNCIEVYPNPDFRIGVDSSALVGSIAGLFAKMLI